MTNICLDCPGISVKGRGETEFRREKRRGESEVRSQKSEDRRERRGRSQKAKVKIQSLSLDPLLTREYNSKAYKCSASEDRGIKDRAWSVVMLEASTQPAASR